MSHCCLQNRNGTKCVNVVKIRWWRLRIHTNSLRNTVPTNQFDAVTAPPSLTATGPKRLYEPLGGSPGAARSCGPLRAQVHSGEGQHAVTGDRAAHRLHQLYSPVCLSVSMWCCSVISGPVETVLPYRGLLLRTMSYLGLVGHPDLLGTIEMSCQTGPSKKLHTPPRPCRSILPWQGLIRVFCPTGALLESPVLLWPCGNISLKCVWTFTIFSPAVTCMSVQFLCVRFCHLSHTPQSHMDKGTEEGEQDEG